MQSVCRVLDESDTKTLDKLEKKLSDTSNQAKKIEISVHSLGLDYLDYRNYLACLEAYEEHDNFELDLIAKQCEFARKNKMPNEKCKNLFCLISDFDDRVMWVECDKCENWYHMLCEGITTANYHRVETASSYTCLGCSDAVSDCRSMETYIETLLELLAAEQKEVEDHFIKSSEKCLDFQQQIDNLIGHFETLLLHTLGKLGVIRQAYHGNSFVGNHCKKILNNFKMLTAVIRAVGNQKKKADHFDEVFELFAGAHHFDVQESHAERHGNRRVEKILHRFWG